MELCCSALYVREFPALSQSASFNCYLIFSKTGATGRKMQILQLDANSEQYIDVLLRGTQMKKILSAVIKKLFRRGHEPGFICFLDLEIKF